MYAYRKLVMVLAGLTFLTACSEQADTDTANGHVWKEQTETIDKAEQVEAIIMDSAEQTRDMIEQSQ